MSIFQKLVTLVKGGATKAGEAIVDANAITIFEQEIKDADKHLVNAKRDLTTVMAKSMETKRKIDSLGKEISKHEAYVAKALDKGDDGLALEIAAKISEFEGERTVQINAKGQFDKHVSRLKSIIKQTCKSMDKMKRELVMVKTTASVQKATQSINASYASSGSKLLGAKESLDRIKKRQQEADDKLIAGEQLREEFEGDSLEDKLRTEGIIEDEGGAKDILARLKRERAEA